MSNVESTSSIPVIGSGILQPAFKHCFRASFPSFLATNGTDDRDIISSQLVSCKFNYIEKTASVTIEVPAAFSVLQTLIQQLVNHPDILVLEILDTAGSAHQTTTYNLDRCLDHSLDFDYADASLARHHLVFSYRYFSTEDFKL
jgi:hypothetical protein